MTSELILRPDGANYVTPHEESEKHTFSLFYPALTAALPHDIIRLITPKGAADKTKTQSDLKKEITTERKKETDARKKEKQERKRQRKAQFKISKQQHKLQGSQRLGNKMRKNDDPQGSGTDKPHSSKDADGIEDDSDSNSSDNLSIDSSDFSDSSSSDEDDVAPQSGQDDGDNQLQSSKPDPPPQFLITFPDGVLWHRTVNVLRFTAGTEVIFFNKLYSAKCLFHPKTFETKNTVIVLAQTVAINRPHVPVMTLFQSLVKRDTMESILYYCSQLGIKRVQPVIATKTQRNWGGNKEKRRLELLSISAAEQSKSFTLPSIHTPLSFATAVTEHTQRRIREQEKQASKPHLSRGGRVCLFFEPEGAPLLEVLCAIQAAQPSHIDTFIGPEGGLTDEEQNVLKREGWICVALTPTVLRSQEAVLLALGSIRAALNTSPLGFDRKDHHEETEKVKIDS
ncbi:putative RsmE family RNA methyltransferase [Blattamonas nauphoetae]|uniref:16S rRNA (uracil(1498)-N(3))-methyltransferase n=1 Tax=Blattamonas nauphoetae TaxID=2049346 RepID=A0ABQ9YMK8_9EUKA|nr:putative RsmE family RNA methyltransferase [Blattamonas nauphoetae]